MKHLFYLLIFIGIEMQSQNCIPIIDTLEKKNKECLDKGVNMLNCSQNYYIQMDSLLNVVYNRIKGELNTNSKEILRTKQLDWLKIRDAEFKKINSKETGLGNGRDDLMSKTQDKADYVKERICFLIKTYPEKYYDTDLKNKFSIFIPADYKILDAIKGNLNLDKYLDYILVLKKNNEETTSNFVDDKPEKRPLLILLGSENNTYTFAGRNDNSVLCYDCGGMMGDPYEGVTIKDGYFSVEHYGGSAWRWTKTITFKYSKEDKNWYLHRDGGQSFHVNDPNKVEFYGKTKKDFEVIKFKDFDIYKED